MTRWFLVFLVLCGCRTLSEPAVAPPPAARAPATPPPEGPESGRDPGRRQTAARRPRPDPSSSTEVPAGSGAVASTKSDAVPPTTTAASVEAPAGPADEKTIPSPSAGEGRAQGAGEMVPAPSAGEAAAPTAADAPARDTTAVAPKAPSAARDAPVVTPGPETSGDDRPSRADAPEAPRAIARAATRTPKRKLEPLPPGTPRFKILIVGDSMAATDFGRALERRLDAHRQITAVRRGKSATGLARPDYFDWMAEAERQLKRHDPDLVVVIIGGNDGQDLIPKEKGGGRRVHWKKPKWKDAYAQRVKAFTRLLMGDEREVAWIELPAMDRRRFERKLEFIRGVQKRALAELGPRVRYVSTRGFFYRKDGKLRREIRKGRKRVALRQDDGIHFSLPGSHYFADRVYPVLLDGWSLTPE